MRWKNLDRVINKKLISFVLNLGAVVASIGVLFAVAVANGSVATAPVLQMFLPGQAEALTIPPHAGILRGGYPERLYPDHCYMRDTYVFYGQTCYGGEGGGCSIDYSSEVWHWRSDCQYVSWCEEGICTSGYSCLDGGNNEGVPTSVIYPDSRFKAASQRQVCEERWRFWWCDNGYALVGLTNYLSNDADATWFQCNSI